MQLTRRQFLHRGALAAAAPLAAFPAAVGMLRNPLAAAPNPGPMVPLRNVEDESCTLSFSTYAMRGIPLPKALSQIVDIGFDGVEIAIMPGHGAEPGQLSAARRNELRCQMDLIGLPLTALMEHLPPSEDKAGHRRDLDRLAAAMELAHDLAWRRKPPLVQTVLGGGKWEDCRSFYRDRLGDWVTVAKRHRVVLAIKPHRSGAMSRPEEAIWLIEQLDRPHYLRMVYDYSHYAYRDMPLEETVRTALPFTAHVAVKDAVQQDDRVVFKLPGEQNTHYPTLFSTLYMGGYRGDICCEVSSMISRQRDYDPVAAAKLCYQNMAAALKTAHVRRRPRS